MFEDNREIGWNESVHQYQLCLQTQNRHHLQNEAQFTEENSPLPKQLHYQLSFRSVSQVIVSLNESQNITVLAVGENRFTAVATDPPRFDRNVDIQGGS